MLRHIPLLQENSFFNRCDLIRNHIELIHELSGFQLQFLFASLYQFDTGFEPLLLLLTVFLFHFLFKHHDFLLLFARLHFDFQLCKNFAIFSVDQLGMSLQNIHHLGIS